MDYVRIAVMAGLAVTVFSVVFVGTAAADAPNCATVSYDGDGTPTNPYEIEDVDQLQCIENQGLGDSYELVSDIDATGTETWNSGQGFDPVGLGTSTPFTGTLDGNGYAVTGLSINRNTDYQGIFGATDQAVVRDLGIEDVSITNDTADTVGALAGWTNRTEVHDTYSTGIVSVSCCAGGLVGEANVDSGSPVGNVFSNVHSKVKVEAPNCCAGGLFGWFYGGTIENSYATGNVDAENCCAGGLSGWIENIGSFSSTVENSYATGDVNARDCCGGGFAGWIEDDTVVKNSYATGDVYSEFCCSGGFAGWVDLGAEIRDSYATGDVTELGGFGGGFLGGIWGGSVTDSFSTGDVQGEDGYIGGFAGDIDNEVSGVVSRNIATGDVTASNGVWVGGFAGSIGEIYVSNVTESAATGNVESTDNTVGGFVGNIELGEVSKSYARGDVTGNDTVGGFVGLIQGGTIDETYSVGVPTATGAGATDVGGFVGKDDTTSTTSIAVTGTETEERGFGGEADFPGSTDEPPIPKQKRTEATHITSTDTTIQASHITNSYWDEEASGTSVSDGGIPLSTSQMTGSNAPTNLLGFDFTNTWKTVRNDYPVLQNSPDLSVLNDYIERRYLGRGDVGKEPPRDRDLSRGETREELDQETGRNSDTARRDRARGDRRRSGR